MAPVGTPAPSLRSVRSEMHPGPRWGGKEWGAGRAATAVLGPCTRRAPPTPSGNRRVPAVIAGWSPPSSNATVRIIGETADSATSVRHGSVVARTAGRSSAENRFTSKRSAATRRQRRSPRSRSEERAYRGRVSHRSSSGGGGAGVRAEARGRGMARDLRGRASPRRGEHEGLRPTEKQESRSLRDGFAALAFRLPSMTGPWGCFGETSSTHTRDGS